MSDKPPKDKVIDFPPNFKAELDDIHKEARQATTEFLKFCEQYFTLLPYIKNNIDVRQQLIRKRKNIMERAFKKLRLEGSVPWQCDYENAQFYTIKKEEKVDKPN